MEPESLGERVHRLRLSRGYTVAGLARAVDVSEGLIRQLEAGTTRDTAFETGVRIAHALGVSPYLLAFGTADPEKATVPRLSARDRVQRRV